MKAYRITACTTKGRYTYTAIAASAHAAWCIAFDKFGFAIYVVEAA